MTLPRRPHHCEQHRTYQAGCANCQAIARKWSRIRARETAYYGPRTVPAEQATAHVQRLIQMGHTAIAIARATGVSQTMMHRIVHGKPKTIHRLIHNQIMNVTHDAVEQHERRVDATSVRRHVQHLFWMGWSAPMIAEVAGLYQERVHALASGRDGRVDRSVAEQLMYAFRQLWDVEGPSVRSKNLARRYGWVSILAWDDPGDPDELPNAGEVAA